MCCSVLQYGTVCYGITSAVCCSVLQFVAVCCSVLQCVAVCCSMAQCVVVSQVQCVAVCCSLLQRVVVCCNVLQCVAVWHSVLWYHKSPRYSFGFRVQDLGFRIWGV